MKTSIKVTESAPIGHSMDHKRTTKTQATAAAKAIEKAIATNPYETEEGRRLWVRTGKLKTSIDPMAVGDTYVLVAPPGYFEDLALLNRLVDTVPVIANPFMDRDVERAFEKSVDEAIQVKGGRSTWRLR